MDSKRLIDSPAFQHWLMDEDLIEILKYRVSEYIEVPY